MGFQKSLGLIVALMRHLNNKKKNLIEGLLLIILLGLSQENQGFSLQDQDRESSSRLSKVQKLADAQGNDESMVENHNERESEHGQHTHEATSTEEKSLRSGEIIFSTIFAVTITLIIYLTVKRRWM